MLAFDLGYCGKKIPLRELVSKSHDLPAFEDIVFRACPGDRIPNPTAAYKSLVIGRSLPVFFDPLLSQLSKISPTLNNFN